MWKSTLLRLLGRLGINRTGETLCKVFRLKVQVLTKELYFRTMDHFLDEREKYSACIEAAFSEKDKKELKQTAVEMLEAAGT